MKKKYIIALVVLIAAVLIAIAIYGICKTISIPSVIGEISGPELDYITIDGQLYEFDNNNSYTAKDRGRFIGMAKNEDITFKIYTVKGTADYIYRLWDWEGAFYKKVR